MKQYLITVICIGCCLYSIQAQDFRKFNVGIGFRVDNILYSPIDDVAFNNPRLELVPNYGGAANLVLTYNYSENIGFQAIPAINFKQTKFIMYEIGGSQSTSGSSAEWTSGHTSLETDLLFRYTLPINIMSFNFAAGANFGFLARTNLRTSEITREFTPNGGRWSSSSSTSSEFSGLQPTGGFIAKSGIGLFKNRVELNIVYHYNLGNYNIAEDNDIGRLEEFVENPDVFRGSAHRVGIGFDIRLY